MDINFVKMHGIGNDYIYIDLINNTYPDLIPFIPQMSDRHFGIGGDGVVFIMNSSVADARMRMFNSDGSEGKMCGNAIRCVAKYLYDNNICKRKSIKVETLSGIKTVFPITEVSVCTGASVNMGAPCFESDKIPVSEERLSEIRKKHIIQTVSTGNPHCVVFNEDYSPSVSKEIRNSGAFPDDVNIGYCKIYSDKLSLVVDERGTGLTLACGTGACAAVAAYIKLFGCGKGSDIKVELPGGTLDITQNNDNTITMTGCAEVAFHGIYRI